MSHSLFNETYFKKNNYFRKELQISSQKLQEIRDIVLNWQKNCETFNPDVDKESTDEIEFVDIVFKKILGYIGKGENTENFNIYPKFKIDGAGVTGAPGFADLALGNFSKNINTSEVVIEFKGQNSNDLAKLSYRQDKLSPIDQCWKYLLNHPSAKWGIVTNFNEIRIYNREKGQNVYETFFFNVPTEYQDKYLPLSTDTEILKFITLLKKENLLSLNGISKTEELLRIKGFEETKVQKEFYFAYKNLRSQIFYEALKHNQQYELSKSKSELLQLVQKLLDRIIFCWFCEDSREHLIPSNVLSADIIQSQIKEKYYNSQHFSIYAKIKDLFQAIDEGKAFGIENGYNGELFKPDADLDALKLPNFLFEEIAEIGMRYDFGDENELNVNILGHIFEQSISDLEEMRVSFQELDQSPRKQEKQFVLEFLKEVDVLEHKHIKFDAKKTKRKKEGVFYTPDHITRYIIEKTVGAWLEDKKTEVTKKYSNLKKNKEYSILREYRDDYLSKIKILDPACGSGAFLIAAFNYLWKEHERVYAEIKEIKNKTTQGELFDFDSISKTILENNLYGVDLNQESVEITKLALWLKTATKNKKLNSLHNNIKWGNSLIEDKSVVGELAFDWKEKFKSIMDTGGFDVVVGNPPYVSNWTLSSYDRDKVKILETKFADWLTGHWDIFICFIAKSLQLLNAQGYQSFILPTSLLKEKHSTKAREKLLSEYSILEILDFGEKIIFENVARQTFIYVLNKKHNLKNKIKIKKNVDETSVLVSPQFFRNLKNSAIKTNINPISINIYEKLHDDSILLGQIVCINTGVVAHSKEGSPKHFTKDDVIFNEYRKGYKKYIVGSDLKRYYANYENKYIDYDNNINHFHRAKYPLLFDSPKVIVRRISGANNTIIAYYDEEKFYSNDNLMHLILWNSEVLKFQKPENRWEILVDSEINLKYVLLILCSTLCKFYFSSFLSTDTLQGSYSSIYPEDLRAIPIKNIPPEDQKPFIKLADVMLTKNKELGEIQKSFTTLLVSEFEIQKVTGKLEDWYLLNWSEFTSELKKKKKILSTEEEEKWLNRFNRLKKEALAAKEAIDYTDKEIDQMVYQLYGLTKEEINTIEVDNY
ncbi:N-6 DNA methylase [Leptospira sp. 201903071]|uniref:Eco57I restriction-modification methylase domain-containing protein n=1 Tax=Leptospira ainazelensis TaxID=2810034 RepID=UPI001962A967|nr:DNA methyltransferase [Leptospira ainazelensis]MBM9500275.1 N-6 DNA methylase [Leptospira ainazelensis]